MHKQNADLIYNLYMLNMLTKNLKYLREESGLSTKTIAELIGVTEDTYIEYESGSADEHMNINALETLSDLYNVKECDLLTTDFEKCDKLQLIRFKKENRESDSVMMHRGGLEIPASDLKEIAHFHKIVKNYEKMDKLLKSEE